jgi:hypothetical protein
MSSNSLRGCFKGLWLAVEIYEESVVHVGLVAITQGLTYKHRAVDRPE